jgi:transposase
MNTALKNDPTQNDYAAFIAIDWADQKHVFSLQVAGQTKKETGTLEQKPEIIGPWVAKLRERFGGRLVAVAVEQSRGALIHALLSYDFLHLYPLHPTTVSKFREAFKFSGTKSDPLDTDQILQILTKHLELLKPLRPDTQETRLLARLVADRRKAVDERTRHLQAAQAALKEYFPQALELCSGNLESRLAHDFLKKWPTFEAFQQAKPSTLKRFFFGHNIRSPQVIDKVLGLALSSQSLTTDPAIVESGSRLSRLHLELIQTLNPIIEDYERRIKQVFQAHPEAHLFSQLPGAGPALAPRLAAFFGTDRSRFELAGNVQSLSGIAPVTKSSGKTRMVYFRQACPKFDRQTFHEFARLSISKCQWARNYVDYYTAKGKKYHAIIRALAFKWIRILFRCWQDRTPYNEDQYMESLKQRGSMFATLHLKTKT